MEETLRILVLEDDPHDAELMLEELRHGGLLFEARRVDTAEDFESTIRTWTPDLIISDYNLPGYDGHSALRTRQQICPEVPFVFSSGTIGEERAIAALKEGATDYVLKDRPARLVPAVRRALGEAKERRALRRAEDELRMSEAWFRTLVENMNDLVWEVTPEGRYTYLSPNAEQLLGYKPEELVGRTPFDLMPPEEAVRVRRLFEPFVADRRPFSLLAHTALRKDGTPRTIECSGRPVFDVGGRFRGYRGVDRDITDRKRLEDELRQTEKMASVGLLIGGVAHELNNPLMGILGLAQLLLADLPVGDKSREDVQTIEKEAKRCKRLIKSLLAFARRAEHQFQLADLNALVQEIVDLKSYDLKRAGVSLELLLEKDLPAARVDPNQIQQVLLNLLNNAEQAMGERKGRIQVRTETGPGSVALSVNDDGPGIPEHVLPKIFEPFFTTKEAGKGTGLGLSICTEIAKEHGGTLTADSKPGKGASFTLRLPLEGKKMTTQRSAAGKSGGRTLVVDDDEMVLKFMARALRQEGWDVEAHSVVFDALEAIRARPFDLVISDYQMPGMHGGEFYRRAVLSRPETANRFIVCTGAEFLDVARQFASAAGVPVLLKPFDLEEFNRVVAGGPRTDA